ncbi:MAG: adenylate/guanylate cyclase domain-containing protein [Candidatus Dormibacter sp.]
MAEERRVVTVLFADVAGSTAMGDVLDPEDVRILLRRYYDLATEVVSEYGGILEKFIGDAVVAVFGLPVGHDDDPQRALAAALMLRDRVRADPTLGDRLPIRLGINTGEVVAIRESATGDFPLTGDAVNVAARLQQAAEPWSIICGERTAESAGGAFDFGPFIEVEVRGKAQPVRASPLLGHAAPVRGRRAAIIGRDVDLQQMELVARRALGEQRPFLVSIIAPAGTGKTRLLEEFLERLPALDPTATVAIAQCLPYGQRLTYWPLRAVLFRLIGVGDDAKAHEIREAIRRWLAGSGLEAADREAELLAATVGAGETEVSDRSTLLAAWRTAFEIAARRSPLVLVFEDLHWSSDSLLDLFEFVMQPRGDLPLLMIALTRPELLDRRPGWGGGRRNYVSLSLEPLTDQMTATLVKDLLPLSSPEQIQTVVSRAEGNPFFAGELVRSLQERPDLDRLPDTVQATVVARLDLLKPDERRTVQLGSVFGRSFRLGGVTALEPALTALDKIADQLMDKELVRAGGGDTYAFRHILIREVGYQTLTRADRGRLHAAAGAWLESQAEGRQESLAELIAYHYREAALLATAQRPNDQKTLLVRSKAVDWLSRAAEVAAAAAASQEGARHLGSAIELAERTRLPELYERLGDLGQSGDFAVSAYQTALDLCREQGRPAKQELRVITGLLTFYTRSQGSIGNRLSQQAMARLRAEAASLAARVDDQRTLAAYLTADAFYPFWLAGGGIAATGAELAAARAAAGHALEIARRLDDANLQSMALDALSGCDQIIGDWRSCRERARERLTREDRLSMVEKVDAHAVATWASCILGDLDDADKMASSGLAHIQPGQVPAWTLHLVVWRIYALTLLGRWDEALSMGERARQLWLEAGKPSAGYALRGLVALVDIGRARQDAPLIETYAGIVQAIMSGFPQDHPNRPWAGLARGDLDAIGEALHAAQIDSLEQVERVERVLSFALDRGQPPALERLNAILELAEQGSLRPLEAQARRGRGLLIEDPRELKRSLELWRACGAVPYAARVQCELALLTNDRLAFDGGATVLERLGDLDQLSRYDRRQVG